jgi:hypothetical protein
MVHDRFYGDGDRYNEFLKELGCTQLYLNYGAKWGYINARSMALIWQEIYKYKDQTENGKLLFDIDTEAYDKDLDLYAIFNTKTIVSDGVKEELKNKVKDYELSIIFLQDSFILTEYGQAIEYNYTILEDEYKVEMDENKNLVKLKIKGGIEVDSIEI